jgi:hypothetical protein
MVCVGLVVGPTPEVGIWTVDRNSGYDLSIVLDDPGRSGVHPVGEHAPRILVVVGGPLADSSLTKPPLCLGPQPDDSIKVRTDRRSNAVASFGVSLALTFAIILVAG